MEVVASLQDSFDDVFAGVDGEGTPNIVTKTGDQTNHPHQSLCEVVSVKALSYLQVAQQSISSLDLQSNNLKGADLMVSCGSGSAVVKALRFHSNAFDLHQRREDLLHHSKLKLDPQPSDGNSILLATALVEDAKCGADDLSQQLLEVVGVLNADALRKLELQFNNCHHLH